LTLGVLWWMTGAVDGSGFTAQRFFAAKTPADAEKGALWYTWSNFILRTWPWVIAAIAALVLYPRPEMDKVARAATECLNNKAVCMQVSELHFPGKAIHASGLPVYQFCVENPRECPIKGFALMEKRQGHLALDGMLNLEKDPAKREEIKKNTETVTVLKEDREISYPLMIRDIMPLGLMGLAFATLIGAFMSTVSTHINWGASYITNDFYKRLLAPSASDKQLKLVGRLSTIALTFVALIVASMIENIGVMWVLWMGMMAGLGVPHLLRWLWWRANAWTELSGLIAGFALTMIQMFWPHEGGGGTSFFLNILPTDWHWLANEDPKHITIIGLMAAAISIVTTLLTKPVAESDLREFAKTVHPMGFWKEYGSTSKSERRLGETVIYWILGTISIYTGMFGIGFVLRNDWTEGLISIAVSALTLIAMLKGMSRIDKIQRAEKAAQS
jgi:SSS family solute:Na+ symporter